jgi:hypothetical protein
MIRGKNKRYKGSALRRKANIGPGGENRLTRRTPIIPTTFDDGSATVLVTFDQAVILTGFPIVTDLSTPSITVNAASQPAPNQVQLIFNAAPTVAVAWPFEDPAVRNMVGGYVQPGTYTF